MLAYFPRCYDKHARYSNAGTPRSHGYESANNVTDQAKEELLQLMLQLLSNQKEVAEAATADKEHLQAMSDSNGDLLDIVKKLNDQNGKLTKQVTTLTDALAKTKTPGGGGRGGGGRGRGGRGGGRGRGGNNNSGNNNNDNDTDNSNVVKCGICGIFGHVSKKCWELEKNKEVRTEDWKSKFE